MPRGSRKRKPINFKDLPCPHRGCTEAFRSEAGRTNHVRTMHPRPTGHPNEPTPGPFLQAQSPASPEPVYDQAIRQRTLTILQDRHLQAQNAHHGTQGYITHFSAVCPLFSWFDLQPLHYPGIVGQPCDENGQYLPAGSPPPPQPTQAADDWTPFADDIQFKLADFLYRQEEMSQGNINHLLELWALSLMQHGSLGPFDSYKHIYDTIDAVEEGIYFILSCLVSHLCETMTELR